MRNSLFVALLQSSAAAAAGFCPFLGPVFPAPKTLSTDPSFRAALAQLETSIQDAFTSGNTSHGVVRSNDTYSIQIFSATDKAPLFDFHRNGINVAGNKTVDGNSIYRIASTTKAITVYLLLLQAGDGIFNDPVTKYLPELTGKGSWDDITVGALAGYMGGIVSDVYGVDGISGGGLGALLPNAFPPLDADENSPCQYGISGCNRETFLKHLATRRQVYLPNTTPAYSNAGFATLGLILEAATGMSYADSLSKLLNTPLELNATTAATPSDSKRGVIIGDESAAGWDTIIDGPGIGMGAMFSSANDMSTIGRAILSSSLLSSNTTRAWLKPTSHTSSLIGAVGRPWEIFRATLGPAEDNRVVDLYTKSGNFGAYGANLVLIPDYDVGFIAMMAGQRGSVPFELSGVIVDHLLPALQETARVEADAAFAGTYTATNGLNSSFVLTTTPGVPGLTIKEWVSNGTNLLQDMFGLPQGFQMYPANVGSEDGKTSSWRLSYVFLNDVGAFSACPSWVALDRPTYGVYGLDELEFNLNEDGKAVSVEPKALKIVLKRQ